jgi:hypothetical protein
MCNLPTALRQQQKQQERGELLWAVEAEAAQPLQRAHGQTGSLCYRRIARGSRHHG